MIVTFYSYKGGVGRSMALVNVGEYLARQGVPVILVDWDLEAPGLERFFDGWQAEAEEQPGVVDLLLEYRQAMAKPPQPHRKELATGGLRVPARDLGRTLGFASPRERLLDLSESLGLAAGTLRLLPAGRREGDRFTEYAANVKAFDWTGFYRDWEGEVYLEWFQQELLAEGAVVLIDSRTGVTEIGGVCVYQLADVVVMLCAANQNNLAGTISMAEAFSRPIVEELRGGRPLRVLPMPARIPASEETEQTNMFLNEFSESLGSYYRKLNLDPNEDARRFLIPQIPLYSFRERVAVRETGNSRFRRDDLTAAYRAIATTLVALAPPESVLARQYPRGKAVKALPLQSEMGTLAKEQEEDREARQRAEHAFRRRLRAAALAWNEQKSERLVLRGSELDEAQAKLKERPESFLPEETRFIAASREAQQTKQHRVRRNFEIAAILILALVSVLLASAWDRAQRREEQALRLESWGLPRDLATLAGQLVVLKLPSSVNRIDWLENASSLRRLDLSGTNVVDFDGAPPSLKNLDISATQVSEIGSLPAALEELKLGYSRVRSLQELPSSIRYLDLSNTPLERLAALPPQLLSLSLDAGRLKVLPELPKTLQSLTLSNYRSPRLPPLPPSLRSLSLVGTGIRSLAGLPFLESLTLINNTELALTGLSPSLDTLRVELAPTHLDLSRLPRALSVLELRRVRVDLRVGLPPGLRELTLVETPISAASSLPNSLRSLTLGPKEQSLVRVFPEGLTSLTLPWSREADLAGLPPTLKFLDLSWSSISSLAGLPENLETLLLNGSNVRSLEGLPPRLRRLEVRSTRINQIAELPSTLKALDLSGCREITELPKLPPMLEELNISNTGIFSLIGLPSNLRRFDIRGSKVRSIRSGLPTRLEVLHLNPLQIGEIGSVPRSLRELYFDEPPRQP
jgi:hypothetical protein